MINNILIYMKEIEKLKAGFEYCYEDAEIDAIKQNAIKNCRIYNSIDDDDKQKQYDFLCEILGSIGENVCLAKTFSCDNGKNIFIGDNFTGNFNITILDVKEVYISNNVLIEPNTTITTVGHPITPKGRRERLALASEITIGDDI